MGGRDGNTYMSDLIEKGVPFYAALKATGAYTRRLMRKRVATSSKRSVLVSTHKSHGPAWCGACYERSKGR